MTRFIVSSLILAISIVFTFSTHSKKYSVNPKIDFNMDDSLSDSIVGDWGIFVFERLYMFEGVADTSQLLCNVCPRVNFKSDNTGLITKPNGEIESIKWTMCDNSIKIISVTDSINNATFRNKDYVAEYKSFNDYLELRLTTSINEKIKMTFVLRRKKY